MSRKFTYHVNLDERGEFYADVRDSAERTVFEIGGEEGYPMAEMVEDGFMKHTRDLDGLHEYLRSLDIIGPKDYLVKG